MRNAGIVVLSLLWWAPLASAADAAEKAPLDTAIDRALQFLQNHQDRDGAWRGGPAGNAPNSAITSLGVMAFLAAGHVPGEGPYGDTVKRGIEWVLKAQQPNGLIARGAGYEMYHHGICTLMLAEVAGMTEGKLAEDVRKALDKAVALTLQSQRAAGTHRGGWRYQVQSSDSDISVTGWHLLALRAAKNLGCDVPAEKIELAVEYIKRCQDPGSGGFCYMTTDRRAPNAGRTGTGILCMEVCGKHLHQSPEVLRGAHYLGDHPPRWGEQYFFYAIYYCSQASFQLGGQYWNSFRPKMHEALLRNQSSNGSWMGNTGGDRQGPNYSTAMSVLALAVEYRFLPIYQRGEEPLDKTSR